MDGGNGAFAHCPAGKVVLNGGHTFTYNGASEVVIILNAPFVDVNNGLYTWGVMAQLNPPDQQNAASVSATAICVNAP